VSVVWTADGARVLHVKDGNTRSASARPSGVYQGPWTLVTVAKRLGADLVDGLCHNPDRLVVLRPRRMQAEGGCPCPLVRTLVSAWPRHSLIIAQAQGGVFAAAYTALKPSRPGGTFNPVCSLCQGPLARPRHPFNYGRGLRRGEGTILVCLCKPSGWSGWHFWSRPKCPCRQRK
jgi:hypothetical protein